MYTAVVLDEEDCTRLTCLLNSLPAWWTSGTGGSYPHELYLYETNSGYLLPHHMTLNIGSVEGLNDPDVLDKAAELTIDAFCWDHDLGVCAARVTKAVVKGFDSLFDTDITLQSTNTQPHVTMCIMPGVKPFESNNLDWNRATLLPQPITVSGVVEEC